MYFCCSQKQNSISQNLAHSYIYSSRSVSLFACVCACYGNKLSFPASAEGQRSEGAVSGSYLFGQTLLVGPHSLIHATLFHSEGWRNWRAFVTSLNEGESWSGDQTNNENRKNYKNKVNVFSVKHGLMENQCNLTIMSLNGTLYWTFNTVWYCKWLSFSADIIMPTAPLVQLPVI